MTEFDKACEEFTAACKKAANWKEEYFGAAYMTRIRCAFDEVLRKYNDVANATARLQKVDKL